MDDGPPPKRSARQEVYGFVAWMATWVILCMLAGFLLNVSRLFDLDLPSRFCTASTGDNILPRPVLGSTWATIPLSSVYF
jgi:hypothetical protein